MLLINKTKLPQIIDIPNIVFPTVIHPGTVFDSSAYTNLNKDAFVPFDQEMFRNQEHVGLHRNYALGDLIQLIPVIRYFKKYYNVKNVTVYTTDDYSKALKEIYKDIRFEPACLLDSGYCKGIIFNLNGILEQDHSLVNSENHKHRVEIYLNTLGISNINKEEFDWSSSVSDMAGFKMDSKLKKIGIQIRGSGNMKTLRYGLIQKIASVLSEKIQCCVV